MPTLPKRDARTVAARKLLHWLGTVGVLNPAPTTPPAAVAPPVRRAPAWVPPVEDSLYPTDEWGIPILDATRQADPPVAPFECWGRCSRSKRMGGTFHFYTEDYRFTALWHDPSKFLRTGATCAVEPNFSAYAQTPRAVVLHRIFQRRWMARYWQTHGIRILVDLATAVEHRDLALIGVPAGWKAYATHGHSDHLPALEEEFDLACERAGTKSITFLVYGGGNRVRDLARRRGWTWCTEQADAVHGRRNHVEQVGG